MTELPTMLLQVVLGSEAVSHLPGIRGHTSNRVLEQRGNRTFPEERSSIVDPVVEVRDSAAGAPLTEEFEVEAGAQW